MAKISRTTELMYHAFLDMGQWGDIEGMTGNYDTDIQSFSRQWKEINKKIKNLEVDRDER